MNLSQAIDNLLGAMTDVSSSYAIWRELFDQKNKEKYEGVHNEFDDFFVTINRSSLSSVVNGLSIILEPRKDTINFRSVLQMQREKGLLYHHRVDQWVQKLEALSPLGKKITILRSNIFAHRGAKHTTLEFSRLAGITPDEIGELISSLEHLLKEFSEAALFNTLILPFARNTKIATQELMDTLITRNPE